MSSMNSLRLRDLILRVRKCRTAAEERSLISRQSAIIRERLKNASSSDRYRYMLMLLYIHMLGYHTEFAQLEVVNLIAQSDYGGKRIGYLALQTLINEKDEVLTLIVNHMKNDLKSENQLVRGVALNAAANIANDDMARDIFDDIIKFIDTSSIAHHENMDGNNINLCKAWLAAVRIARKAPDYAEYFLQKTTDPFVFSDSGALTCVLTLVNTCLKTERAQAMLPQYRKLAGKAAQALKKLVLYRFLSPYEVNGVTAPYTQIKILEFIEIIGNGSVAVSEVVNDVLTQTMMKNDVTCNTGAAVHYACVRTINNIESDDGLRTLAINKISHFLSSTKDNNLRFVALQMLAKFATANVNAVQEHQSVILSCLKDADVSIRRRALSLTVMLINAENVRLLVPDLISYLALCAEEMREEVTGHICNVIELQSPTEEWRVEVSLQLLKVAKQAAPISFATKLMAVLSRQPAEVQSRAVVVLWDEVATPFDALHETRKALLLTAIWTIGEYDQYIIEIRKITAEQIITRLNDIVINTGHKILKQYGLTALMKIGSRQLQVRSSVLRVLSNSTTSTDTELQQRACEYVAMLTDFPTEAASSFARMPPIPIHEISNTTLEPAVSSIDAEAGSNNNNNSSHHRIDHTDQVKKVLDVLIGSAAVDTHGESDFAGSKQRQNETVPHTNVINSSTLDDLFSDIAPETQSRLEEKQFHIETMPKKKEEEFTAEVN